MTLFISLRCTQTCKHCLFGCSPARGEHMSWAVFTQSVAIAKKNNIHSLNFFGGEPMCNPLFFPMVQTALENNFGLIVATNCSLLENERLLNEFRDIIRSYKDRIVIITSRDRFHLQFFDPSKIVECLRINNYKVVVNDWSDYTILLSGYNANNKELQNLDTSFSCCNYRRMDYLGVLPDGSWQICPSSLEAFGNIFSDNLGEIIEFKRSLPLRYEDGCTECLKAFPDYRRQFEISREAKSLIY